MNSSEGEEIKVTEPSPWPWLCWCGRDTALPEDVKKLGYGEVDVSFPLGALPKYKHGNPPLGCITTHICSVLPTDKQLHTQTRGTSQWAA